MLPVVVVVVADVIVVVDTVDVFVTVVVVVVKSAHRSKSSGHIVPLAYGLQNPALLTQVPLPSLHTSRAQKSDAFTVVIVVLVVVVVVVAVDVVLVVVVVVVLVVDVVVVISEHLAKFSGHVVPLANPAQNPPPLTQGPAPKLQMLDGHKSASSKGIVVVVVVEVVVVYVAVVVVAVVAVVVVDVAVIVESTHRS